MRKEALAFFTMFSLILMLSIYYITLPKENKTTVQYESVISSIEENKEANKNDKISANEEVISNPNASIDEIEQAITENEELKNNIQTEKEINNYIREIGHENSVEIKENTIFITVLNEKEDDNIAISIMKYIYSKFGNKYLIEVSFSTQ